MNRQRGGPAKKGPMSSRLSMPAANPNPNLTTIKTVDIGHITKQRQDGKPQQSQENKPQNQGGNQFNRGNQQQQKQQQQHQKQQQQKEQDNKQQGTPSKEASKSTDQSTTDGVSSVSLFIYNLTRMNLLLLNKSSWNYFY